MIGRATSHAIAMVPPAIIRVHTRAISHTHTPRIFPIKGTILPRVGSIENNILSHKNIITVNAILINQVVRELSSFIA